MSAGLRTVRPAVSGLEVLVVPVAFVAVAGCLAAYLQLRPAHSEAPKPLSWQVRSFDGLGAADQAIHGALLPAAEEIIWFNNDTGGWITPADAQRTFLPPFYRDGFWKKNGEVRWELILPGAVHSDGHPPQAAPNAVSAGTQGQGATVYYGSAGTAPAQSAYLLVIGHAHAGVMWANQASIWIHPDPRAPYPAIVKSEALVGKGWRQVIAYDGNSEVERIRAAR